VKHLPKMVALSVTILLSMVVIPVSTNAQLSKVKTVWVILMENHNWTGNNAGAAFGAPDIKGNPLAPYVRQPAERWRLSRVFFKAVLKAISE
jgi:hypothetical protein